MMNIPQITPTPKGTRISLGVQIIQHENVLNGASYYANLCNIIAEVCDNLQMKYTEDTIREYARDRRKMLADYLKAQLDGIKNPRLKALAEHEAKNDFDKVCRLGGISNWEYRENAKDYGQYVTYDPTSAKPFKVDNDEVNATCETFLTDDDLPKYDLHRLIAALLTQFLGGTIERCADIADFFYLTEDGQVLPYIQTGFFHYPPVGAKIKDKEVKPIIF